MANMNIKPEVLNEMRTFKVHPKEADNACLKRIIDHYKELCPNAPKVLKQRYYNIG